MVARCRLIAQHSMSYVACHTLFPLALPSLHALPGGEPALVPELAQVLAQVQELVLVLEPMQTTMAHWSQRLPTKIMTPWLYSP